VSDEAALASLVRATPWLMQALLTARALGLGDWCMGAGAVRDRVWDALHGRATAAAPSADVDLVFHDPARAHAAHERAIAARLRALAPAFDWEPVNQAAAHHAFAQAPAGHASLAAAIASWPETATCVGVFLDARDDVGVIAPLGLADLFAGVLRFNPGCADAAIYRERIARKRFLVRWPALRCVD